jgi:hypothetical protein
LRFLALAAVLGALATLALPSSAPAAGTASINGVVTDAATEAPVKGAEVCALGGGQIGYLKCELTDSAGEYAIEIPAGSYVVSFSSPPNEDPSYVTQWWQETPYFAESDKITLAEGESKTGISAALEREGRISGFVTDATTGEPVSGVNVCALTEDGELVWNLTPGIGCAYTENGAYTILHMPAGTFEVEFSPLEEDILDGYLTQYWDHVGQLPEAAPVPVEPGAITPDIDAALQPEGGPKPPEVPPTTSQPPPLLTFPTMASPSGQTGGQHKPRRRCRRGFRRKLVHGKRRCVRVKRHHPRRHAHHG